MVKLVGLHGIGHQQSGRHQMCSQWRQALLDGMERAAGHPIEFNLPLDIAFYGDVFLPRVSGRVKGHFEPSESAELEDDELDDLREALTEAVGLERPEEAVDLPPVLGYTAVPPSLQPLLRMLDRIHGVGSGILFFGVFRQVRLYLRRPEISQYINDVVDRTVTPETVLIVGHSLGAVVAFEYVRRHLDRRVSLLTLGAPLGLRAVRRLMPDPMFGCSDGLPPNVAAWTDVRDRRDPVTCAGSLRRWWSGIEDQPVHNGGDAHAISRYLAKAQTGAAVTAALQERFL